MKRFLLHFTLLLTAMMYVSCRPEIAVIEESEEVEITARGERSYIDDIPTRSVLMEDGSICWSPSDSISLFINGSKEDVLYISQNASPASEAVFKGSYESKAEISSFAAIYPYRRDNIFDGTFLYTYLPSEQKSLEGSFSKNAFISVARSATKQLMFYNVCGGIRFTVYNEKIKKVTFINNDGGAISGRLKIGMNGNGVPFIDNISEGVDRVSVIAPDGGYFNKGQSYFAVIPPVEFTKGITILYESDIEESVFQYDKAVSTKRAAFSLFSENDKIDSHESFFFVGGQGGYFSIYAEPHSEVEIEKDIKWISLLDSSDGLFTFLVEKNEESAERSGTVTINSANARILCHVTQAKRSSSLNTVDTTVVDYPGGSFEIAVDPDQLFDILIPDSCTWIKPAQNQSSSTNKYSFIVDENADIAPRSSYVYLILEGTESFKKHFVTQKGIPVTLELTILHNSTSFILPAFGGTEYNGFVLWGDMSGSYFSGAVAEPHIFSDGQKETEIRISNTSGFSIKEMTGISKITIKGGLEK